MLASSVLDDFRAPNAFGLFDQRKMDPGHGGAKSEGKGPAPCGWTDFDKQARLRRGYIDSSRTCNKHHAIRNHERMRTSYAN